MLKVNESFEKTVTSEKVESWRYPRFFCRNIGENVVITGGDAAHIFRVLRMREGDIAVVGQNVIVPAGGSVAAGAQLDV